MKPFSFRWVVLIGAAGVIAAWSVWPRDNSAHAELRQWVPDRPLSSDASGVMKAGGTGATALQAAKLRIAQSPREKDGVQRQTAPAWTGSATEFDTPGRDRLLNIEYVMDELKIKRGSAVADIGAGGGWFTIRAGRRVGPAGVVYANEILPRFVNFIEQRAKRDGLKNVRGILGTANDPKLPANSVDAVLILNAYHEFEQPLTMLRKIKTAMRTGARLGFIERDDSTLRREAKEAYTKTGKIKRRVSERPDKNPKTDDHRLARDIVQREAASVGLRTIVTTDLGGDNYLVVVTKD
jgi:ubiquinone/menaquinone biosynthesis C-methylase UbiE